MKRKKYIDLMLDSIPEFTNERLLEEMLEIAGGDDHDGCFTKDGTILHDALHKELYTRLNGWLRTNNHYTSEE